MPGKSLYQAMALLRLCSKRFPSAAFLIDGPNLPLSSNILSTLSPVYNLQTAILVLREKPERKQK